MFVTAQKDNIVQGTVDFHPENCDSVEFFFAFFIQSFDDQSFCCWMKRSVSCINHVYLCFGQADAVCPKRNGVTCLCSLSKLQFLCEQRTSFYFTTSRPLNLFFFLRVYLFDPLLVECEQTLIFIIIQLTLEKYTLYFQIIL